MRRSRLCYGHGADNPRDEAVFLVLGGLGIPFDAPPERLLEKISHEEFLRLEEMLKKRTWERLPVAYLLNKAWFAGLCFFVDERVLVPRSPIAELIQAQFLPWAQPDKVKRILDIGAGSGCIAIACAAAFPEARVDATDNDPQALEVAAVNCERHEQAGRRVNLVHSRQDDLYAELEDGAYDIIVSNPPYVPDNKMVRLPLEYQHEPREALAAGALGVDVIRRILPGAAARLAPGGVLVVETGAAARDALEEMYPRMPFTWLEFERGGEDVFLLTKEELSAYPAS